MELAFQEIKNFKLDKDSEVNDDVEVTFLRLEFSKLLIEIERKNNRKLDSSSSSREEKQIPSLENQLKDEEEENANNFDTNDFQIEEDVAKTHE
ncbi:unnamed protein product [Brachionus calyciflorus]|uniref:Uncharacterized protein n=1 Tax=Brachionus calyciflorus TaxID=104777 RepID=A0A813PMY3_9BILA|nr:unnamed protein product [Brachionus calyciflorus]